MNKPFVGHGKLQWIGDILLLWTNKVIYFQLMIHEYDIDNTKDSKYSCLKLEY